jgi:hypothetical protein
VALPFSILRWQLAMLLIGLAVGALVRYLYVGAIVLLVAIELDELLRKHLQGRQERGILELVRDVL